MVGQSVAATTRGAGGTLLGRLSARRALIIGGCVAGGGILLESLVPWPVVAAVGLALGAGGASLFWPLVMSTVSGLATQVVSAVGTFTAAGLHRLGGRGPGGRAGSPRPTGPARGCRSWPLAAFAVALVSLLRPRAQAAPRDGTG